MSIIQVINLVYVYGRGTPFQVNSLQNVSITIDEGEFLVVVGPTGSGKSTLIQHLNGLLKPTAGKVVVLGIDTSYKKAVAGLWRQVGLVFQYPEIQLFGETVYEDVAFGPRNTGANEEQVKLWVRRAMEQVDLDYHQFRNLSPFTLSAGQRRRVAMAGVLALQPRVLVLDEPTAGLDPVGRKRMLQQIKGMQREGICTVVLVTHNMEDAAQWADRMLVLEQGKVLMQGTPRDIFSRPEELAQIGLEVPFPATLTRLLRESGYPVEQVALTIDEAEQAVKDALEVIAERREMR